jgi:hypothetical protein
MKKRSAKSHAVSVADLRGVETFDTNDMLLLARAPVEEVARALVAQKKLKTWHPDALGKTVSLADPSYLVLRLAGHDWSLITACVFSLKSFFKPADAQALSRTLKGKVIFFANSDTGSATEYELFDAGKSLEHFRCVDDVEFKSSVRKVAPPKDGPDIYTFVDAFIRAQGAFVPACSIHFQSGWLHARQKFTLAAQDEIPDEMIERMDYLG